MAKLIKKKADIEPAGGRESDWALLPFGSA